MKEHESISIKKYLKSNFTIGFKLKSKISINVISVNDLNVRSFTQQSFDEIAGVLIDCAKEEINGDLIFIPSFTIVSCWNLGRYNNDNLIPQEKKKLETVIFTENISEYYVSQYVALPKPWPQPRLKKG